MTQKDTKTYTIPVSNHVLRRMYRHRYGDDYLKEIEANSIEDDFHIEWDDTNRNNREAVQNSKQGFVAEAAFAEILDRVGAEYNWGGSKGEADFKINGKTIDVKSRQSKCEYRNLIKDYVMSNSDTVDLYVHTNVHYDPISREEITAVEFVGFIANDEVELRGEPTELYQSNDYETEKKEVHPKDLKPISNLLDIV